MPASAIRAVPRSFCGRVGFQSVISGVHAVVFTQDAERARAFFRDTLGLSFVDAGGNWLIFALPSAGRAPIRRRTSAGALPDV